MNQIAHISYEDRAKARAVEVRRRLMGTPKRVNIYPDINMVPKPKPKEKKLAQIVGPSISITMTMPIDVQYDRIGEVHFGARTMREIADEVLLGFSGVTFADIKSRSRLHRITRPRQLIVYAIKTELPNRSFPEIGRFIGGKDHTTCMHAYRKIMAEKARVG